MPIQPGSSTDQPGTRRPQGCASARPSSMASPDIATVNPFTAAQFRCLQAPSCSPPPRSPSIVQKIFMTKYGAMATTAPYAATRPTLDQRPPGVASGASNRSSPVMPITVGTGARGHLPLAREHPPAPW
jgi:hypothetical protein